MRIAMFTDTYTPQVNGVVTSIQAFRSELERQGHEVHIFAPDSKGVPKERNVHRIRSFPFAPYRGYKVSVPDPRIITDFERIRADVIHVHTPISIGAVGLGLARHFNVPVVGTFHTLLPEYMHYIVNGRLRALMKPAQRIAWDICIWFYNRCDAVIAPSRAIAGLLKEKGVSKRISIVPTGICIAKPVTKDATARFRKKYNLHGKVLLHVGRVTREKNIEAIIDAVDELPDVALAVASDGPHMPELKKYITRKGLSRRVRFLGYLPKPGLAAAYATANVFVCASKSETQGIVLLEAATAGLPIVALDAPVVSDFVRENRAGVIATKDNFAHAIESALGNKRLLAQVKNRAKSIANKYSIERCTKELVKTYENAIRRSRKNESMLSMRLFQKLVRAKKAIDFFDLPY